MTAGKPADGPGAPQAEVIAATEVITSDLSPRRARNIILLLAACVALMMTGFGIIMPVFARRFGEFGSGVEELGLMTTSFALAQLVAAPFLGSLADRFGRRPWVLLSLAAFSAANVGFLLAHSTAAFIAVRTLEGALSAGLFPATMGIVADIVPEDKRAQWVGIVMGSYGVGFIFGPVLGGVLYDGWGFEAPFVTSAALAFTAFVAAAVIVPETRPRAVRRREELRWRRAASFSSAEDAPREDSLRASLPRPLYVFGTLLFLDFMLSFTFAFVEPQMVFYFYEELGWSTVRFGAVVGAYGLVSVAGQTFLGRSSDRFGRKPVIVAGVALTASFYVGLAIATSFPLIILTAVVAGLGGALTSPAASAFYLDITAEQHRSRILGIKSSAASLGGVTGPLLVVVASALTSPQGVFGIAGGMAVFAAILAATLLKESRHRAQEPQDPAWAISSRRAIAAQAALRGVVLRARTERERRTFQAD